MAEFLRILLFLGIAGSAVTLLGSAAAWWQDEDRRLLRIMRRALGGDPDAAIVARGRNAAAAVSLDSDQALVIWEGGAKALLYPLQALQGAELIIDDQVAARVFRGESRRPLDQIDAGARRVTLRLVFDNPRDPDFELDLWLPRDLARREAGGPAGPIQEARSWLARVEAIFRRPSLPQTVRPPIVQTEPESDPPWDEDDEDYP